MDILEIIGADVTLRREGKEHTGACPWCGGSRRLRVWAETQRYWCRQCNRKGDAIQYLRDYRNMTYPQAAKYMGKPVEERKGWVSPKDRLMAAHRALREEWKTFGVEWALCRAKMTQGLGMSEEFRIATLNQLCALLDRERDLQQRQDTIDRAYNMLG
jgi:ssDNA-binding Zn-finger/Zn-ribbon topoisomerase 1